MGVTNTNKELDAIQIECGGSLKIRLSLTAEPNIVSNPTDIVLILDRSGNMGGIPLANLKNGAKKFVDIIDEAKDSSQDGQIGGGSHIGIVSFADTAEKNTLLITSVTDLKTAVDSLTSGGLTNHEDAFTKALELFDPNSSNAKVMVMFTDGLTTAGGNPNAIATLAKSQGVSIYVIGLSGNGGIDEDALKEWASDPDSAYVAITPDDEELEDLFENLANNITKPGATNIVITDKISPCFKINSISSPSKGIATLIDTNTLEWKIDELGVNSSEGATIEFSVSHLGTCTGEITPNENIDYTDDEGNIVTFPSPTATVLCNHVICPESCPEPIDISISGCSDTIVFDAGEIEMESLGRIVQLNVTLKEVCPLKKVALAVILNEVDANGIEHKRGLKTMTIPAHTSTTCQNILIKCIKFILPEDLDVSNTSNTLCNNRDFKVRFIAHYIDYDYECCNCLAE